LSRNGPKVVKATLKLPTVTAGSFEAADSSVGTIIVNTTSKPRLAIVEVPPGARAAALYRADRTEVKRWETVPAEISLTLEPYGARMLVAKTGKPLKEK
jgi:hypothetical protein